jgi:hypothetical protein
MADIVISGDSSGSVTLRAPAVSGTTVLTLPTTSGTIVTTAGATSLTTSGNLTFTGTGNRILGDFSNATATNRVIFQTSTTNSNTVLTAIPNGTATGVNSQFCNNSDPTNSSVSQIVVNATESSFRSAILGTGTYLPMTMYTGGSERLRIDTSGNVGIGISSPAYKLSVNGTGNFYNGVAGLGRVFFGDPADPNGYIGIYRSSLGPANWNTVGNGLNFASFDGYTFSTGIAVFGSQTERMRIDSGGGVIIAGTAQIGSARFSTYGGAAVGDDCWSTKPITNITYNPAVYYNNAGTLIGFIQCSTSGTTFGTSSDYRLKENIAPMTGALAKVSQLKPCTYTWKADGSAGQGFIAHELQEVVPDCVTGEKDAVDEEGNIKPQGIDTSFLVATLTAAIQELNAKVTALEAQLGAK